MNGSTITLPKRVFDNLIRANEYFEHAQNELEDYFLSHNKAFIVKTRKARRKHKNGRFLDWQKIKSRYGI